MATIGLDMLHFAKITEDENGEETSVLELRKISNGITGIAQFRFGGIKVFLKLVRILFQTGCFCLKDTVDLCLVIIVIGFRCFFCFECPVRCLLCLFQMQFGFVLCTSCVIQFRCRFFVDFEPLLGLLTGSR